ncbi:phosphoribosyltransferase [Roseibium sp. TrichSKD4]|uniref:ComF family protein n=1 Tax=Roseibium sp. TrichSKD4 TaxID=744980 RepID=UPI0001E56575|nr:phosphoribosyltransferase [Roseibium sp. TrichSKD4]
MFVRSQAANVLKHLPDWGAAFGHFLLDSLLPPRCATCPEEIARGLGLCSSCWQKIRFIEVPVCHRFGTPFSHEIGPNALSPRAIASPPLFERARAACLYDGPARDMVHALKFSRRRELSEVMGRWMVRAGRELLVENSLLIPVPLHRRRLWSRQFNQAADLSNFIARQSGADYHPMLLVRSKKTSPQVGLTAKQREKNIRGAFKPGFPK